MNIRTDRVPPSAIPSMRNPERFREFVENFLFRDAYRHEAWENEGVGGYEEEIGSFFGSEPFIAAVSRMVENNGKLKITSFGGGRLQGLLDFREMLKSAAKELQVKPQFSLVEYALTKDLAHEGLAKRKGGGKLEKSGELEIHIGPVELRDLGAAKDSDVMLSRFGPFYHAANKQEAAELVAKAAGCLAPGGSLFFHLDDFRTDIFEKLLGTMLDSSEFVIGCKTVKPSERSEQAYVQVRRV